MAAKKSADVDSKTTATTAVQVVEKKIMPLAIQAKAAVVCSNESYEQAGELRRAIKGVLKEVDGLLDPIIKAQYEAHRLAVGQKKSVTQPLIEADAQLMKLRLRWEGEVERQRREAEERLKLAALEQAKEQQMQEAMRLAEEGLADEAMALMEEPVHVVAVSVESQLDKGSGFSSRGTWSAECVDLLLLIESVYKGNAPIEWLEFNQQFGNKQAQAFHGGLQIPGVVAKKKLSESVRL